MSICKGCGAEIRFIHTPKGKYIPCDAQCVSYIPAENGRYNVVTYGGEVVKAVGIVVGRAAADGEKGFLPHWANCPASGKFRRKSSDRRTANKM